MNDYWKAALLAAGVAATGGLLAAPAAGGAGAAGAGAGGLLGAGEAAATPSLLGNIGTAFQYGTNIGSEQTAMLAAQDAGMGGGMFEGLGALKPVGQAAVPAMQAYSMFRPQQQPTQPPPVMQQGGGPGGLSNLVGQNQQMNMQRQQDDMQRRMRQQELIARMGGFNGRTS